MKAEEIKLAFETNVQLNTFQQEQQYNKQEVDDMYKRISDASDAQQRYSNSLKAIDNSVMLLTNNIKNLDVLETKAREIGATEIERAVVSMKNSAKKAITDSAKIRNTKL